MQSRKLHVTWPHAAQEVWLKGDDTKPANRAYILRGDAGRIMPILGSEIESLLEWWSAERKRVGIHEEVGSRDHFWPWQDPDTGRTVPDGTAPIGPVGPMP